MAVTFAGAGYLYLADGSLKSIRSIIDLYKTKQKIVDTTKTAPNGVTLGLDSLLAEVYNKNQLLNAQLGNLEIMIAGYNERRERRIYRLIFPKVIKVDSLNYRIFASLDSLYTSGVPGVLLNGQADVWTRLMKGYDPRLIGCDCTKTVKVAGPVSLQTGKPTDSVSQVQKLDLDSLRSDIRYDVMTLQDAVDFAVFVVRATIEMQRFDQSSIQGVGGAIDIAVITSEGFHWIQHKELRGEEPTIDSHF